MCVYVVVFSQVTTPLLFKFIPVIMQLGILMGWFSSDSTSSEVKLENYGENFSVDCCSLR